MPPTPKAHCSNFNSSSSSDFSALPNDLLTRIAATFSQPNLMAASLVCRAWRDALKPLREAMTFLMWGKRFKHGRGGVKANLDKALDSFLKGASRGSALAMVDAGSIYWELGKVEESIFWFRRAAELGDAVGQCNLAISYVQATPPNNIEAVKWLYKASVAGYIRAQYQLALCFRQGLGVKQSAQQAAHWFLRAAEGGYARAMYNTSLCYALGEGLKLSHIMARMWMKKAADHGHSKAQFDHGRSLFYNMKKGDMVMAAVYLELAARSGESSAVVLKNSILQRLSDTDRDKVMRHADNWRALPSTR